MDFCPICGVAVDVRLEQGKSVFVCRNPQCEKFGMALNDQEGKEDVENG